MKSTIDVMNLALDQLESDWCRIDREWGPTEGGLEGAIARGEETVIPMLRAAIAAEEAKPPLSAERSLIIESLLRCYAINTAKHSRDTGGGNWEPLKRAADMLAADAQHGYTAADVSTAHAKGYDRGLAQVDCFDPQQVAVQPDTSVMQAAPWPPSAETSQQVAVPQEVLAFLIGSSTLDGVWFGERHPTKQGAFWWREYLSVAAPQPPQAERVPMTEMVDAAMVEMANIHPPLRRKECERLIGAALAHRHIGVTP